MCEKALADFMESKRRAFPRFYFTSTQDLLDILSNGNNPVKVRPGEGYFFMWLGACDGLDGWLRVLVHL